MDIDQFGLLRVFKEAMGGSHPYILLLPIYFIFMLRDLFLLLVVFNDAAHVFMDLS